MNQLWIYKYRPTKVGDVIVSNERDREKFDSYVATGEFPNLLFSGPPGTGKSSMSNALVSTLGIDRSDVLRVKCSDEKIDALRDRVKNFAATMPIGKFKVVQLEEVDGIGHDAMKLLRTLIEDSQNSCRFIGTCNYLNLILPALRSRFQEFTFTAPLKYDVCLKAAEILEAEHIDYSLSDLEMTVEAAYPDFRKVIQLLESNSIGRKLRIDAGGSTHDWKLGLLPLLEAGDIGGCRKLVCETASKQELVDVYRFLYHNLHRCHRLGAQDEAIVLLARYQFQHGFVELMDPELNVAACFIEIAKLIS